MEAMVRHVLVIALVGTSLLVAACGGDDGPPESSTPAGTTAGGDAAPQVPPVPDIPPDSQGSGDPDERAGSGDGRAGGDRSPGGDERSGGDASPRRGGSRGRGQPPFTAPGGPGQVPPTRSRDAPPLATSDSAARRLAREICANVTLEGVALNLRISLKVRDAKFVARAFSRRFPADHRDAAYDGCLDGFRNPVARR